jgi:hypothetical protein
LSSRQVAVCSKAARVDVEPTTRPQRHIWVRAASRLPFGWDLALANPSAIRYDWSTHAEGR